MPVPATAHAALGWQTILLLLPGLYWLYRPCRAYLAQRRTEKSRTHEMADLHLRTIEAFALAIEAKDSTSYEHLHRLGIYAAELGRDLGLSEAELQALQVASLLHDIGKLAVPEHIISKADKLTAVEFEKMKIHLQIGARILERVEFPYPVAPIVHAHHEKWDGTGYPMGAKGEEIPIGARILAVLDCLDSMTTDRRDRRAHSRESALAYIVSESGKSFDPRVVAALTSKHADLEDLARGMPKKTSRLSKNVKISRGAAPAAGYASDDSVPVASPDFLSLIAAARHEGQALFELAHELGNSLSLDETLSVLAFRLKRMCPCDSIAIYVLRDNVLVPEYADGEHFQRISSLRIPCGEGLSGWVAENRRPIVNGNPAVEPLDHLQSALAVPLEGMNRVVGVLTLYAAAPDTYTSDHLRLLSAVTTKIALSIENALKYRYAESRAVTDELTDLPNARSLFMHLDRELARSKRDNHPVSILVCDLDGFKQVNDHRGHIEGNKVLRTVAHALRDHCREYDYVARMGGDEFVIVLSDYPAESVAAKKLMLAEVVYAAASLTLSIGEASYPMDGSDADELLAVADRRMYQAKHSAPTSSDLRRLEQSLTADPSGGSEWLRITSNTRKP